VQLRPSNESDDELNQHSKRDHDADHSSPTSCWPPEGGNSLFDVLLKLIEMQMLLHPFWDLTF